MKYQPLSKIPDTPPHIKLAQDKEEWDAKQKKTKGTAKSSNPTLFLAHYIVVIPGVDKEINVGKNNNLE